MLRACLYRLTWAGVPFLGVYAIYIKDQGISAGGFSQLLIMASITGFACEVPSGMLADWLDRRTVLHLSSLAFTATFVSWLFIGGYWGFATGFVCWGIAGALRSGTLQALMFDDLKTRGLESDYPKTFALSETGMAIGAGVGLGAAGPLMHWGSSLASEEPHTTWLGPLAQWDHYTLVVGVTGVVLAAHVASVFLLPRFRVARAKRTTAATVPTRPSTTAVTSGVAAGLTADDPEPTFSSHSYWHTVRFGLGHVRNSPALLLMLITLAVASVVLGVEEFLPRVWHDLVLSDAQVPLALAFLALFAAAGNALAPWASQLTPGVSAAFAAISALLIAVGADYHRLVGLLHDSLGVVMSAVGFGMALCLITSIDIRVQKVLHSSTRATVTSIFGLFAEVGSLASFVLVGGVATMTTLTQGASMVMFIAAVVLPPLLWRAITKMNVYQENRTQ